MGLIFGVRLLILFKCEQTPKFHVGLPDLHSAGSIWTHFKDSTGQKPFQGSRSLLAEKDVVLYIRCCSISHISSGPENGVLATGISDTIFFFLI